MKKYILSILIISLLASCSDYQTLEKNPNLPTSVPSSIILRDVLSKMNDGAWNTMMRNNQFYCSNYNYYDNNEYNWGNASLQFTTLKNVVKMEEEAKNSGAKELNPYSALGKFLRAYYYTNMTLRVGDLPVKDALQGLTIDKPKYDTQKEVFVQILKWLEDSNNDLAQLITTGDRTLDGDIYYGNDLRKWQKSVNSLRLRVLIHLSKRTDDTDLKVKADFANVLGNPTKYPLMSDLSESLQYVWSTNNKYPRNPDNLGNNATRENMAKTYIDLLKNFKDPRLFVVAEPAEAQLAKGLKATDFDAYVGASSGEDLADMSSKAGLGQYSFQSRKRYYSSYTGENTFVISYPEMCFNIAEAINQGWATGNAQDWYEKGVKASMSFYGIADATAYLAQTSVKYAGNNATGLTQILNQKYLAFFQNSGYEAYYNWRRTGVPTFLVGPGTANGTKIPLRYLYPSSESSTNLENLTTSIARQFGGSDNINASMWLIK
ncbi:SusD-like starch-binding protein associating with outer membrane [Arcicella aurantiaca]|uniref:SusD-like starch-binding protein associating with outer membrane n=1 Tax=Arcicella aurantiaca TaxID=591202 RepID=A0A316EB88_9BACT|nr:SusD/RagB family nutrient-binding outer membrane lipoprotein [Arcicella aurantiaca]PWK27682.1 SusD-like starch-binding protein associating with outer membrane [Arcicella aurantiaca]